MDIDGLDGRGPLYQPGPLDLNFEAPVSRALVHRRAVSEVFITDIAGHSANRALVGAQWPRWHVFYGSNLPGVDSALMAETLRQAVIVLAHTQGVPLTHKFLLPHMDLSVTAPSLDGKDPVEVAVELEVRRGQGQTGIPSELSVDARFFIAGKEIGRGNASARMLSTAVYERFRDSRVSDVFRDSDGAGGAAGRERLLDPSTVGHESVRNVVLGAGAQPQRWFLHVDQTHPIFFDHPLDHVPGMLLIEASRQALRAASGIPHADFSHFTADFFHLVEFGHHVEVAASLAPAGAEPGWVAVDVVHGDRVLMSVKGRLAAGT